MPVTFQVASHPARSTPPYGCTAPNADGVVEGVRGKVIQSSIAPDDPETPRIIPTRNGFVHAAILAYGGHYHLKIR